ncbi:MAG TPA: polyphosphate kinase 2 [Flavobacteriales bacterium]|jgi:polyphosphate kinase 2|nr:polyphosphate kinase 2 [Flavobacteriales bacterium]
MRELSKAEIKLLETKKARRYMLKSEEIDIEKALRYARYEDRLKKFQSKMVDLLHWVNTEEKRVVIIFEGRDAAGKGGAIRRMTHNLNPRLINIVALPRPTEVEMGQWYFQRYVKNLPDPGEMVFFDRSWYNRAVVEPVNGFCTAEQYDRFMDEVNDFERMIINDGIILLKLYFSITREEQRKRFEEIRKDPLKRWKYSNVDAKAQELWNEYTRYRKAMIEHTDTEIAPWKVIKANRKMQARLIAMRYVLSSIPYEKVP